MNNGEYRMMFELENFYWWFVGRRQLLVDLVSGLKLSPDGTALLDVGCGTGLNCKVLSKYGAVFGADCSSEAMMFCRSRELDNFVFSRAEHLRFIDSTFDVVTAMDVLEHTDDDLIALKEIWRVLRPGGTLIVTVPAYGFLWSEHDEALHHRRRYTAHELRNKLTTAGFTLQRSTYFITLLFFPIFFFRLLQNLTKKSVEAKTSHIVLPTWLNWFLVRLLDLERIWLRFMNLPFGVTVLAVGRKPDITRGDEAHVDALPQIDSLV